MRSPIVIKPKLEEIRVWGLSFRGFNDAYATGIWEGNEESLIEGGLLATVPIKYGANQIKDMWHQSGLSKTDADSGWHLIDNYDYFELKIITYKVASGFIARNWFSKYGFIFSNQNKSRFDKISVEPVGYSRTKNIPETIYLIDRILKRAEWPLVSYKEAIS